MGTTAEKLTHLSQTKSDIRDAIEAKGVSVPVETTFRDYATKVNYIKTDFSDTFNYAERVSQDGGSVENLAEVANLDFNDGATLNFIPSGKKAGKSYSQVPTDGSGDWTIDRNCEATYIDKEGVIQTAQANEPRFDWSSGKPALLVEPQRTNLIGYSQDYDNTYWTKQNLTSTGQKITVTNVSSACRMYKLNIPIDANKDYTIKLRIKDFLASQDFSIRIEYSGGNIFQNFNPLNGDFKYSFNLPVTSINFFVHLSPAYYQSVINDFLDFSTQIEKGSTASSYIKTEGATVTRLADIIETTPPAGTTQIIETIDGIEQTPITTIPATYQIPEGNINQIKML